MLFFNQKAKHSLRQQLAQFFDTPGVYFVYANTSEQSSATYQQYVSQFVKNNLMRDIGLISSDDSAIIPYLTVKANLLINGHNVPLELVPSFLNHDTVYLEQLAEHLTPRQSLDIQFFRSILAGKRYIFMDDGLSALDPVEVRNFLVDAIQALKATESTLIVLTTDHSLLESNPETAFETAPKLI